MTTDIFRQKLVVDGGIALDDDLNFAQRFTTARMMDQIVSRAAPRFDLAGDWREKTAIDQTPYAYALNARSAGLKQGASGNNYVGIGAGTLLQKKSADTGTEETMIAYTFTGTEQFPPIANGDVSNPRVDLLQMQLAFADGDAALIAYDVGTPPTVTVVSSSQLTTRRVQCTLSVKQGTPAASPVVPTLDAGCVAVGMVVVGTAYVGAAPLAYEDSAGAVAVLHDLRMPLSLTGTHVHPREFSVFNAGGATLALGASVLALTAINTVRMWCPVGGFARILGFGLQFLDPSTLTSVLGKLIIDTTGTESFILGHGANLNGSGSGSMGRRITMMHGQVSNLHTPAAGPTVQANAAFIGPPMWTNGKRAPIVEPNGSTFPSELACVQFTSAPIGTKFGPFTWYTAS